MIEESATLLVLLSVLVIGFVIPELLKRFRLPLITLIILAGSLFGPYGFDLIETNQTLEFFGFLGMTFLMFMAGLETQISRLYHEKRKILTMALLNGVIPFIVGFSITYLFGYSLVTSFLIGIIFISSSVAVIIPSLRHERKNQKSSVKLMFSAVLITDIISLIGLGIVFQNVSPVTLLPLPLYFGILLVSIPLLIHYMPKITQYFIVHNLSSKDDYEKTIRFVLIVMISILTFFTILGVHPILAAFLAGLALSSVVIHDKSGKIYEKIHTLGYGLFVPVFFFIVGMEMDLRILYQINITNLLMISLILGLIISKIVSGYFGGRLSSLSKKDSLLFGVISMTQLTTTLAVTYTASELGIIDTTITTSIILLSVLTTFLGPTLFTFFRSLKNE